MNDFEETPILTVDFNNVADDGRLVKAAIHRAKGIPMPGRWAILRDPEGNRCLGRIERIQGPIAFVAIDDATWVSGEDATVATGLRAMPPQVAVG